MFVSMRSFPSIPDLDPGMLWIGALLAGVAYAVAGARRRGLDPRTMYWAGVCAVAGGVWGSHLLVVGLGPNLDLSTLVRFWSSGKSFLGGVGGGALAVLLYLRWRRLPVAPFADAGAPAVALGYVIGRLGCFINGDDYGVPSQAAWAVQFPAGTEAHAAHVAAGWIAPEDAWSLPVHPTQLYEAALGAAILIVLTNRRFDVPGRRACAAAVMYGTARFALEWWRGDWQPGWGPFSVPQIGCMLLVATGLFVWCQHRIGTSQVRRGSEVALHEKVDCRVSELIP